MSSTPHCLIIGSITKPAWRLREHSMKCRSRPGEQRKSKEFVRVPEPGRFSATITASSQGTRKRHMGFTMDTFLGCSAPLCEEPRK